MATTNKPGTTTFTTPSDREILCTRVFDAPSRLFFDAWTRPEHLPHWMLGPDGWTMPVCEIDLRRRGVVFRLAQIGRHRDGNARRVFEIAPPERLVSTESWGGDWPETINTLVLCETDGKTTFAGTVLYPSKQARDAALQTGMKEGIAQSLDRLAGYLRTTH